MHAVPSELADTIQHVVALHAIQQPAPPPRGGNRAERWWLRPFSAAEAEQLLASERLEFGRTEQSRRRMVEDMIAFEAKSLEALPDLPKPWTDPSPKRLFTRRAPCVTALSSRSASTVAVPKWTVP